MPLPKLLADSKLPNTGDWQNRHNAAVLTPSKPFEKPMVKLIDAWVMYADQYKIRFESTVGNDGVLGPAWEQLGRSIHALLNGDTGNLDCGTLSHLINTQLKSNDCEEL